MLATRFTFVPSLTELLAPGASLATVSYVMQSSCSLKHRATFLACRWCIILVTLDRNRSLKILKNPFTSKKTIWREYILFPFKVSRKARWKFWRFFYIWSDEKRRHSEVSSMLELWQHRWHPINFLTSYEILLYNDLWYFAGNWFSKLVLFS